LGVTTIFVTHDLGEAMAMSDRMALLLNGEIVALDKPETLFHRPRSVAAARFMGVSTFLYGDQACPEQGRRVTVKNEAGGFVSRIANPTYEKIICDPPRTYPRAKGRLRKFNAGFCQRLRLSRRVRGISNRSE
jgi:ABC-type Fe3+/spermidine/putrescine transport system ATPase subunit